MRLYLGGYLDYYNPKRGQWLEVPVPRPTPLPELLQEIGVPISEVHMVVLRGETMDKDGLIVSDEDEVKLYSAVGGG